MPKGQFHKSFSEKKKHFHSKVRKVYGALH
jgi:hypothetical protein